MLEIKCPKCGETIELGKDAYNALLSEIETQEIDKRVNERSKLLEDKYKTQLQLEQSRSQADKEKEIGQLKSDIALLREKLNSNQKDTELAVSKAVESAKEELLRKDSEIALLKSSVKEIESDSKESERKLKEHYEFVLKTKDEQIERYKEFRLGDSTKDLGESLEQYCHDAFDEIRAVAYPNAYFEKDNEVDAEGKGDFIFRDFDDKGVEFLSIMFEMKNEKDDTVSKHKNEDFFKKLDKNRTSKGCEYAVLVTTLEKDSKLYNNGIVDVSHKYPKMFVVRPQNFLAIIGLLRSMALNNLAYRQQVIAYQKENVDITHFEDAVNEIVGKINKDYEHAGKIYGEVEKMCNDIIKKVEKFRDDFRVATGWIGAAKNQLPELNVRKLTKNNPTMKAKFDALDKVDIGDDPLDDDPLEVEEPLTDPMDIE